MNPVTQFGAPLEHQRAERGEPIAITFAQLAEDKALAGNGLWTRLLAVPFRTARNSIVFVMVNYCGNVQPSTGVAVACRAQLQLCMDQTTSPRSAASGFNTQIGTYCTPYFADMNAHSSNKLDEQQIEGLFVFDALEPGPHLMTIDIQAFDGAITGSGEFTCNAASNPFLHGCSVTIEEYGV